MKILKEMLSDFIREFISFIVVSSFIVLLVVGWTYLGLFIGILR